MANLRILIADDNQLVRRGIARVLSDDRNCQVCGEASDARETLQKVHDLRPDLVLLDMNMPDLSGLETARRLRLQAPGIKIVIISQNDPSRLVAPSLDAGAHGCVDTRTLSSAH